MKELTNNWYDRSCFAPAGCRYWLGGGSLLQPLAGFFVDRVGVEFVVERFDADA